MARHPTTNTSTEAKPTGGHTLAAAEAGDATDTEPMLARASAMLPAELLQPGEVIILLLKPSAWFIVLVPLRFIAVTLLCAALAVLLQRKGYDLGADRYDLALIALGVIGVRLFWQVLDWLGRVYVLTDQRIIRIRGVLNVQVFECPLQKVQQTDLILPLMQRFFWLGTIGFATAGTAVHEAYWFMIARPLEVHAKVVETMRRYRR